MKVLVTGTSKGIGKAIAELFLERGHTVIGFDTLQSSIDRSKYPQYTHYAELDIAEPFNYPHLEDLDILINNAGIQTGTQYDIDVNLRGTMALTEKYLKANLKSLKSILFIGSVSAHTGWEFPTYVASKSGLQGYAKNVAVRAAKHGIVVNSLDPGGVLTELNLPVIEDPDLWNKIMKATPLKRWATPKEIAEWAFFLTVTQSFCTGQCIVVDGGEKDLNSTFVWPSSEI